MAELNRLFDQQRLGLCTEKLELVFLTRPSFQVHKGVWQRLCRVPLSCRPSVPSPRRRRRRVQSSLCFLSPVLSILCSSPSSAIRVRGTANSRMSPMNVQTKKNRKERNSLDYESMRALRVCNERGDGEFVPENLLGVLFVSRASVHVAMTVHLRQRHPAWRVASPLADSGVPAQPAGEICWCSPCPSPRQLLRRQLACFNAPAGVEDRLQQCDRVPPPRNNKVLPLASRKCALGSR